MVCCSHHALTPIFPHNDNSIAIIGVMVAVAIPNAGDIVIAIHITAFCAIGFPCFNNALRSSIYLVPHMKLRTSARIDSR